MTVMAELLLLNVRLTTPAIHGFRERDPAHGASAYAYDQGKAFAAVT